MAKQLGYIKVIDNRCKGCELCIPDCPVDIIFMNNKVNKRGSRVIEVSDMSKCIACNLCALSCPDRAIEVYRFIKPSKTLPSTSSAL